MGFLASAAGQVTAALAVAMRPPPPPDLTRWCQENIEFGEGSAVPGAFDITRFEYLREIHAVMSPEHPCREVTLMGSAQIGKTESVIHAVLGCWHEHMAVDSLIVHPTDAAATEWKRTKWLRLCRTSPSLRRIFGTGNGHETITDQETLDRSGSLKTTSAGSPASLTGTSRRLVVMDDVAKFDMTDKGDPEALAVSRASGFEDAKILRVSTPLIKGPCRITRAFERSDQRQFEVPCPHCGTFQALTWENFKAAIDPERLHAAHFTCESCGQPIRQGHKDAMIRRGRWRATNPNGDHPGFFLWRAYAPMREWASIAVDYAIMKGWTRIEGTSTEGEDDDVAAETEQTFFNDVLGLPYETASDAPDWKALRDRTEKAKEDDPVAGILDRGVVPADGVLLTAGVDCQDDRTELQIVAFGRKRRRWTVDYVVIPHHIGTEEARAALDAQLKRTFRTELGLPLTLDMLAIDGGAYTDDVWSWAKVHPWGRVIIVKGASTQTGPLIAPQKFEQKRDGRMKRRQKRAFIVNVSAMKAQFYTWLRGIDPDERGYCRHARGLGDEFYRQLTAEVRVLIRSRTGVVTSKWDLVEPGRRNEALDTALYAEVAARRKSWAAMTDDEWDRLEAERGRPADEPQPDLFAAAESRVPELDTPATAAPRSTAPAGRSLSEMMRGL